MQTKQKLRKENSPTQPLSKYSDYYERLNYYHKIEKLTIILGDLARPQLEPTRKMQS